MESGEIWAYRKRGTDPLEPAQYIRHRKGKGRKYAYSLVRFEDPEADGLEEWVPDSRLKCLWSEAEAFLAREQRWTTVRAASVAADDLNTAIGMVIEEIVSQEVITAADGSAEECVFRVLNPHALGEMTGLSAQDLQRDPESFWDEGHLIVPLATSFEIAKRLARGNPERVIRDIEREERAKREEDIHFRQRGLARTDQEAAWHDSVERSWQIRREWVGQDNNRLRQDALAKLKEAERLTELVEWAIAKLEHYGHETSAKTLKRYLDGAPIPVWRSKFISR